jgi:hypothetical protein
MVTHNLNIMDWAGCPRSGIWRYNANKVAHPDVLHDLMWYGRDEQNNRSRHTHLTQHNPASHLSIRARSGGRKRAVVVAGRTSVIVTELG